MGPSLRSAACWAAAAAGLLLLDGRVSAQTSSACNPLNNNQCPANSALGMAINVDFAKGAVNSFAPSGKVSYDGDGASFTVAQGGDAPQLGSLFYIMFGRVEITIKAAPGAGIVSSLVLESDDLDEIDVEWLGSNPDEVQSNYFGKGQTTTYNRGQFHRVDGTQGRWIKYTVDWTRDRIVWMADGRALRTLEARDAAPGQYPQTPMRIKFGSWAGGDPARNAPGTVEWARGPTDYAKGPFAMHVRSVVVADYSSGRQYRYRDQSGAWSSIEAVGGAVNGNFGNRDVLAVTASAGAGAVATRPGLDAIPVGGIARDDSPDSRSQTGWPWVPGAAPTGGSIPAGWHMTSEGKIMRDPSAAPPGLRASTPLAAGALLTSLLAAALL